MARRAIILAICAAACRSGPQAAPEAEATLELRPGERLMVRDQTLTGFTAVLPATLVNPFDEEARAVSAKLELQLDGKAIAQDEVRLDAAAPAGGEVELELALPATYVSSGEDLLGLAAREQLGALLRGEVRVEAGGERHALEFSRAGPVRAPRAPEVTMQNIERMRSDGDALSATFFLAVKNPNPFEVRLVGLRYALRVNGKPMLEGTTAQNEKLPAGAAAVYELPVALNAATIPEFGRLVREGKLAYGIAGELDYGLAKVSIDLAGPIPVSR